MTLRFAIRDDDVCFHTNPDQLHDLYNEINQICPISFSCIPFVGGYDVDNYLPEKWEQFDLQWRDWQTKEILPIGDNLKLVELLKDWCSDNRATIMMHGIHHDLYEFLQDKDFKEDIREAKQYLEGLFSRSVTTSSPPNNSLGPAATKGLIHNNFNILMAFGHLPKERPISARNYLNFVRLLFFYFKYRKRLRLTKPMNFGTHQEQPCYEIGPSTTYEGLVAGFEFALAKGGNFVIATHYYHLVANKGLHKMLIDIVAHANNQSPGKVEFVCAEELFETL